MQTNLVELLEAIRRVMYRVEDLGKTIDMHQWYKEPSKLLIAEGIYDCETPACVAGWAALDSTVCELAHIKLGEARELDCRIGDINSYLQLALFDSRVSWRADAFLDYLYRRETDSTDYPIENYGHLTKDKPTPDDVIQLLDTIIEIESKETANAN